MRVNEVHEGDCLDVMRQFPDNCIDSIVTDPPYGLSFMGKDWDYGLPGEVYWREALRVAKPGATLMAFGGTRTHHRLACAIEDAGWEIRDCVNYLHDGNGPEAAFMASLNEEQLAAYLELHYPNNQMAWVYGSGIGLGHAIGKAIDKARGVEREVIGIRDDIWGKGVGKIQEQQKVQGARPYTNGLPYEQHNGKVPITAPATPLAAKFEGYNTRLKPAYEPIVVAQAPLDGTYAGNAEKWGIAGLNIDGCRIEVTQSDYEAQKAKQHKVTMGKNSFNGVYRENSRPRQYEPSTTGRYPANLLHSGEPGVMAEFARAGVREVSGTAKLNRINYGGRAIFGSCKPGKESLMPNDTGTAARYFATCPPDEAARFIYCPKASPSERATPGNNHPTVKPLSLTRYLVRLCRPPDGGIVLDPFAGSGTTALACLAENRDYILIEKEAEYAELCRRRIAEYTGREIESVEIELAENETVKQLALW